jgi:hypothetical protein
MEHAAAVSLVLGVVLTYSCWRTLHSPWPQYETRSGGGVYQHIAFAGLVCGIILIVSGLALGAVCEFSILSKALQQAKPGGS